MKVVTVVVRRFSNKNSARDVALVAPIVLIEIGPLGASVACCHVAVAATIYLAIM